MAKQLYVIRYGPTLFKIGCSERPRHRFNYLKSTMRYGMEPEALVGQVEFPEGCDPMEVERRAHSILAPERHGETELFTCPEHIALKAISLAAGLHPPARTDARLEGGLIKARAAVENAKRERAP